MTEQDEARPPLPCGEGAGGEGRRCLALVAAVALAGCVPTVQNASASNDGNAELSALVCPAYPGIDTCTRHTLREFRRDLEDGLVAVDLSLRRVELQSEARTWRELPTCSHASGGAYLLFPVSLHVRRHVVERVSFPERVDTECGEPSPLTEHHFDAIQEGCSSAEQCNERGFQRLFEPYIKLDIPVNDLDGRRVIVSRPSPQGRGGGEF